MDACHHENGEVVYNSWLEYIFNHHHFMCRGECGAWDDVMLGVYVISAIILWVVYTLIPFAILYSREYLKEIYYNTPMRVLFALPFIMCGIGHLLEDVGAFVHPDYHLFAIWKACTAIVSTITLVFLLTFRAYSSTWVDVVVQSWGKRGD